MLRAAFLESFDQEAACLPPQDAAIARRELERHLNATIQARLEMGASFEQAEAEAVRALESPKKLVRKLRGDTARHFDPAFCRSLGLMLLFMTCTLQFQIHWSIAVTLLALVTTVFFAALRARTFQWKALLFAYPLFSLWVAIGSVAGFIPTSLKAFQLDVVLPWMAVITIITAVASGVAHARLQVRRRKVVPS